MGVLLLWFLKVDVEVGVEMLLKKINLENAYFTVHWSINVFVFK